MKITWGAFQKEILTSNVLFKFSKSSVGNSELSLIQNHYLHNTLNIDWLFTCFLPPKEWTTRSETVVFIPSVLRRKQWIPITRVDKLHPWAKSIQLHNFVKKELLDIAMLINLHVFYDCIQSTAEDINIWDKDCIAHQKLKNLVLPKKFADPWATWWMTKQSAMILNAMNLKIRLHAY